MEDFLGAKLEIGDKVVLTRPNYRDFVVATVIAFTPKKVRVEYPLYYGNPPVKDTYLAESNFLIKIPPKQ